MGITPLDDPRELEELLGAYALDACDPEEAAAVERYLATSPEATDEVARLRAAAAWIGATEAMAPPSALRAAVLDAARARRGAGASDDPVLGVYVEETARFDAIVDAVPPQALDRRTFNGLSIRDLVIHVAAQHSMLAASIGRPVAGVEDITDTDIEARTAAFIGRFHGRPVDDARAVFARAVAAVERWAQSTRDAPDAPVNLFGLEMERETALLELSFEIWIHADDVRRVLDRRPEPPRPASLNVLADMSMRMLPVALALTGRARAGKTARVVLTGDGGGDWVVPMSPDAGPIDATSPDVVFTTDVVDWCLLAAERITSRELRYTATGERELVDDVLEAAPVFATL
ncbi:MAG: maleylpyruvate isomerase family mycothiol-dependent enzyme [Acidimicrobiia bacterium]